MNANKAPFDAVLITVYGGPESIEDIPAFLDRMSAVRPIPPERRAIIEKRYREHNGYSPLNEQCRTLQQLLSIALSDSVSDSAVSPTIPTPDSTTSMSPPTTSSTSASSFPVYWGNLYAPPLLETAVTQIHDEHRRHVLVLPTSPFDSPQIDRYRTVLGSLFHSSVDWEFVPPFANHEKYIRAAADTLLDVVAQAELTRPWHEPQTGMPNDSTVFLFSAHALPWTTSQQYHYEEQLSRLCQSVMAQTWPDAIWELGYQSRAGRPSERWNEPDINVLLHRMSESHPQCRTIFLIPIGFMLENMETRYDLDEETCRLAQTLGLTCHRAATCGLSRHLPEILRQNYSFENR